MGIDDNAVCFGGSMELVPFKDFHLALDKALGKHGSQPKQVITF